MKKILKNYWLIKIKTLFFVKFDNKFNLCVLALNELKIATKINSPKNAVNKCSLLILLWYISLNIGNFKNKIQSKEEYAPVKNISWTIYLFIIDSPRFLVFSFIYSIKGGSNAKARPASVSITILTHNICITVTGVSTPINGPIIDKLIAHKLTVNWNIINLLILLKIDIPNKQ